MCVLTLRRRDAPEAWGCGYNRPNRLKGAAIAPVVATPEKTEKLTEEQKKAILDAYNESLRDNGVDAMAALEEIRAAHGF